MRHELKITGDRSIPADVSRRTRQKERFEYTVTAKSGLFKNGKVYAKGDKIMLDAETAGRFKTVGEVE